MRVMREQGIEPKRLRLFCRRQNARPSLVLLEGRRGGREGLEILPSLFGDSEEFQKMSKTFYDGIRKNQELIWNQERGETWVL